jgi:hypothetical protein
LRYYHAVRGSGRLAQALGGLMTFEKFSAVFRAFFPVDTVVDNPGGGTSKITKYSGVKVLYKRGRTVIPVSLKELHGAYEHFKGSVVSSAELRKFKPAVFNSAARPAGHSCNCTFFFCALSKLNLSGPLLGSGVAHHPFSAAIHGGAA